MILFAGRAGIGPSGWQRLFVAVYCVASLVSLALGNFVFALCFAALSLFFALNTTDLDLFAPMSMVAHAFGIYFLLPLALMHDRDPVTLPYIAGTLIATLLIYVSLPRLNFGFGRRLGRDFVFRKSLMKTITLMQVMGYIGFLISTRLAGYSNPIKVFADPLQYRFFMMVGGMTYFTELLSFFIMIPAIVVTVACYMKQTSRIAALWVVSAAIIYGLATGARGSLISLVIEIFLVRHLLHKRIGIRLVLFTLCLVVPFIAISGQYRSLRYVSENVSLRDVVSQLSFNDIVQLAFSRLDAARMFDALIVARHHQEPKLGLSYAEIFIEAIPRTFWPNKPRLPNPEMTRIVGRDDPNLDIAFDFGIFGETFLNFSWYGILIGAGIIAIVGGLMQCVYDYAAKERSPVVVVLVALFCFYPMGLVVSGLVQISVFAAFVILKVLVMRKLFFRRLKEPLPDSASTA